MHRRDFLAAGAALGCASLVPWLEKVNGGGVSLKITGLEFWRLKGTCKVPVGRKWQSQVQPLHVYDEFRPAPYDQIPGSRETSVATSAIYLKILTDRGVEGLYGPIDGEAAVVVDRQLRNFLIGKDALKGEILWDQLYRSNRHSRAGHFMMAISAVDNVLWDLRGRYFEIPVYRLLGGPSREEIDVYGSCLGYSVEPSAAAERALQMRNRGFQRQKWFFAHGPGDGSGGLQKNVALVRNLRDALGDESDLMFDAFMGWDLQFAVAWARQAEPYRPRWIEEAFAPNRIDSFIALSRETSIPVATGEHFYSRWEVNEFLRRGAISVVQADPEWCGGVSELVKICTLASLYDAHVVPHGHSLHAALHVVASQSPMTCPMVEYLIQKMESYYHFERHQLQPVNGKIRLHQRPGFGIDLDEERIESRELLRWS